MATINQIEIYKQRYETYRHLDRLRWQMLQIAVGAGSLILAFAGGESEPDWWIFAAVGLLLIIFGSVMLRIGHGINMNSKVLSKAASAVGDVGIPPTSKRWKSVSFWVACVLIVLGSVCVVSAWYSYPCGGQ